MLFIFQTVKLMYLGESLRNVTVSWASHFPRSWVIFSFKNLLPHQLFLEVRTVCFLQHLNKFSGNVWKTDKVELALNSFKMKTAEKGEIKQVTFVCLTAFVSKAKCPLITQHPDILCSPTGMDIGYPGVPLAECKYGCCYSLLLQTSVSEPSV